MDAARAMLHMSEKEFRQYLHKQLRGSKSVYFQKEKDVYEFSVPTGSTPPEISKEMLLD